MKDEELYSTIDYQFDGDMDNVIWLEEICDSLNIDYETYWMREVDEDSPWMEEKIIVCKEKPVVSELYFLTYSLLVCNYDTNPTAKFAEYLIDSMLEYVGYLEACLIQEKKDNKKGYSS